MTKLVRPLRGGQITIPAAMRKRLGITDDTLLQLTLEGAELRIRPVKAVETAAGSPWLRELYDLFAPVRDEAASQPEAEVDAAIDRAVRAVRRGYANRRL
jgi:bifunctional DNA-binding transcriptional regulator/antitoxin component of YhaV-PrlF toxin-antitoxin module